MRHNLINIALFIVAATGLTFLWIYAEKHWVPRPEPQVSNTNQPQASDAAKASDATKASDSSASKSTVSAADRRWAMAAVVSAASTALESQLPARPAVPRQPPPTLIPLGGPEHYLQVLLSTQGGGVQQVVLTRFEAADRLGRPVRRRDADGRASAEQVPLYLIPGVRLVRGKYLREEYQEPRLVPGPATEPNKLAEPTYRLFHYPSPEDKYPDPYLGETHWQVVDQEHPENGTHRVVFEQQLGEPYYLRLRKIYTLAPRDYHIGLQIEISRLPLPEGRARTPVRLQIEGPRGLPIEGEWYTWVYRVALIGWRDAKGGLHRQYEDAATVAVRRGGEVVLKGDNTFKYIAVMSPYFTSALAIDDEAEQHGASRQPWAYTRATTELPWDKNADPNQPFLSDLTVRAATEVLDPAPGETVRHRYIIYNGPAKVGLLSLMPAPNDVDDALVDRYKNRLDLRTITDFYSPSWLGRFAYAIYWSDLVIAFTNLMHWLLTGIHRIIPSWAMSIVILTVMVRLLLFIPSRKQTQMNLRMMEVQKKLAPQLEELKKKYAHDPGEFNREKMRLLMAHGVNPFSAMGGCLLLVAQMPVMMGLYFCLQESIFFRLQSFLWIDNLAAPDMLFWWGEHIPFISTPDDLGGLFYLGPYFNLLPILAVGLMLWQQNKMMPPPTDEQMAQQQQMMKIMLILMGIFFYKIAAGLVLYFIISTLWGMIERQFIPKTVQLTPTPPPQTAYATSSTLRAKDGSSPKFSTPETTTSGMLGRLKERLRQRLEELQRQADEQAKRQIRNNRPPTDNSRRKKKKG
jgi:YidC/Oxa1 family membrane protein insertase